MKGIYEGAFIGNTALKNITVPESIVEVSDYCFYGCKAIEELPFDVKNQVKGIYDYAFAYSGIKGDFTVPDSLYDIGDYAFIQQTNLPVQKPAKNVMIVNAAIITKPVRSRPPVTA